MGWNISLLFLSLSLPLSLFSVSSANTSNDLAIDRHIQEDLDQLALSEDQPSGAVGTGPPPPPPATADSTMSYKSNFESLRFLSDDPNYYGKGYEIGRGIYITSK